MLGGVRGETEEEEQEKSSTGKFNNKTVKKHRGIDPVPLTMMITTNLKLVKSFTRHESSIHVTLTCPSSAVIYLTKTRFYKQTSAGRISTNVWHDMYRERRLERGLKSTNHQYLEIPSH